MSQRPAAAWDVAADENRSAIPFKNMAARQAKKVAVSKVRDPCLHALVRS